MKEIFLLPRLGWQEYVETDPRYFRPTEVNFLLADLSKARKKLGWDPRITFRELVKIMVGADMEAIGLEPIGEGKTILEEKFRGWHRWDSGVSAAHEKLRYGIG